MQLVSLRWIVTHLIEERPAATSDTWTCYASYPTDHAVSSHVRPFSGDGEQWHVQTDQAHGG